ncbi:hypothetical protein Q5H91_09075 [Sphingomonas sp. KR1UV-12]|uniref:Major facilitator superfamily (MFS) profile domain-containing protein n=1 Tax=Sphingomonas aurea TaxID=3063994 RepID=A0ABT9EK93_9SPHN|nr:hypothetical protein [Sphingomonas sp. KR1UV-12]MDP1027364.1 hypothetical protein [Sphingomonas sp. KR1UV-12]
MLSIASLMMAAILLMLPAIGFTTIGLLVGGAACLAIVAPFDAMQPPARKRVVAATLAYVLTTIAAAGVVAVTDGGHRPLFVLAALAACGLILFGWAFKTRNRRRRAGWTDYFD